MFLSRWLRWLNRNSKASRGGSNGRTRRKQTSRLQLEQLEGRVLMSTLTWGGGGTDALWSNAANWTSGVAPVTGDQLVFQSGAARKASQNDFLGASFEKITLSDSGYTLTGNKLTLGALGIVDSSTGSNNTLGLGIDLGSGVEKVFAVNANGHVLEVTGALEGSAALLKSNQGTLKLSGASASYTGQISIIDGVLSMANVAALGTNTAGTVVLAGATLTLAGNFSGVTEPLTLQGDGFSSQGALLKTIAGSSSLDGQITLPSNAAIRVNSGDLTLNGKVTGASGFTKEGPGVLILPRANDYQGVTLVHAGTLTIRHGDALGSVASATTLTDGATLSLDGGINVSAEPLNLAGVLRSQGGVGTWTGPITLPAGAHGDFNVVNAQLTVSGTIGGSGDISMDGAGRLILTADNSYSGFTTVSAGFLNIRHVHALGLASAGTSVFGGATLEVEPGVGQGAGNGESLNLNGSGSAGTGAVRVLNGGGGFGQVFLSGNTTIGVEAACSLSFDSLRDSSVFPANLTKLGSGSLFLSGANVFQGSITIAQGILSTSGSLPLGLGGSGGGTTILSGATLILNASHEVYDEPLTLSGAGFGGIGALVNSFSANTLTGLISLVGDTTMSVLDESAYFVNQLTISGVIQGGFGLTKIGAAVLEVSGATANVYTGTTTVNEGTLLLNKPAGTTAVRGPLVIGDGIGTDVVKLAAGNQIVDAVNVTINGGVFNLNNQSETITALTMTAGAVNTGSGSLNLLGDVTTNVSSASATINGNLSLATFLRIFSFTVADGVAASDLIINAAVSSSLIGGLDKLGLGRMILAGNNTYFGATAVRAGDVTAMNSGAFGTTAGTTVLGGARILLVAPTVLVPNGSGGFTPVVVPLNIGEPLTLNDGATLLNAFFVNTWNGPITLAGGDAFVGAVPGTVLTLSGVIGGPGGLTLPASGAGGVVVLSGGSANTYTGLTRVLEGVLSLNKAPNVTAVPGALLIGDGTGSDRVTLAADNQIADAQAVTINKLALLDLANHFETIGPLLMNSGAITTGTGTLTLGADVTVNAVSPAPATIAGHLDLGTATRNFTVANTIADSLVAELAISAVISGIDTAGLTKQGAGTMELTGNNNFQGLITVAAGQLNARTANALAPEVFPSDTAGLTIVQAGATLLFGGNPGNIAVINERLGLAGTLESAPGVQTWGGQITINGTAAALQVGAGNTMVVTGRNNGAGNLTKRGAGTVEYTGTLSNFLVGTTTVREGLLLLNKPSGVTAINGPLVIGENDGPLAATIAVRLNNDNQIATVPVTINALISGAPTLDLNNRSDTIGALTMTRGTVSTGIGVLGLAGNVTTLAAGFPASTISGIVDLGSSARTFTSARGQTTTDLIIDAEVRGTGGLIKAGPGILVLTGSTANFYSGTTTVNEGTVLLGKPLGTNALAGPLVVGDGVGSDKVILTADNQISDLVLVSVNSSGVLDLNSKLETIASLAMTGGLVTTGAGTLTLLGNVTTAANDSSATINGILSLGLSTRTFTIADGVAVLDLLINARIIGATGAGLIKNGAGMLDLTADNSYSGLNTVNAGALAVDGTQTASPVLVNSTATLAGKGSTGPITAAGGTVDPGSPAGATGVLSTVGNLSLNSASILQVQLNDTAPNTHDVLNVLGPVNLGSSTLAIGLGFTPVQGTPFTIVNNDASDDVLGRFIGIPNDGDIVLVAPARFSINYHGGDGNDVVLTYLDTAPMVRDVTLTASLDEGQVATLTGVLVDPNAGDVLKLQVDWGDGSPTVTSFPGLAPFAVTHRYLDSGNFLVHFVWSDNKGGSNERTLPVTVRNVAPLLTELDATADGLNAILRGTIVDPSARDTFQLVVSWGDGISETFAFAAGTTSFELKHSYQKPGNRKIHMTLTDDDGGTAVAELRLKIKSDYGHEHG